MRNKIYKHANARGEQVPLWIDRVQVGIGRVSLQQHLHQTIALQIALNVPLGAH